jgi:hypothetical protein
MRRGRSSRIRRPSPPFPDFADSAAFDPVRNGTDLAVQVCAVRKRRGSLVGPEKGLSDCYHAVLAPKKLKIPIGWIASRLPLRRVSQYIRKAMFCGVDACFVNAFDQLFALAPLWEVGGSIGARHRFRVDDGLPRSNPIREKRASRRRGSAHAGQKSNSRKSS